MGTPRTLLAVVALVAAMAAPAVAAPKGSEPVVSYERTTAIVDDGTEWFSGDGTVWHKRGWTGQAMTFGDTDERLSGTLLVEINWNVNLTTWSGNLQGSADYTSDVYPDSGWLTTWSGQWIGPGAWAGRGVGTGFGAFDGMKIRYDVANVPGTGEDMVSGFVFTPGRP